MAINEGIQIGANIALLDSASTHTILQNQEFFKFPKTITWRKCDIITIARNQNIRFREGRTTTILPGRFLVICERAMYAPSAPRSLINYKDLRANNIHISTTVEREATLLELQQGQQHLTAAKAEANGLYEIIISDQNSTKCEEGSSLNCHIPRRDREEGRSLYSCIFETENVEDGYSRISKGDDEEICDLGVS